MRVGIPQFRISGVVVVFAQLLYIIVHNTTAHIQGFVAVMQNLLEIGFTCIWLTMIIVMFPSIRLNKYFWVSEIRLIAKRKMVKDLCSPQIPCSLSLLVPVWWSAPSKKNHFSWVPNSLSHEKSICPCRCHYPGHDPIWLLLDLLVFGLPQALRRQVKVTSSGCTPSCCIWQKISMASPYGPYSAFILQPLQSK
jgi:hypothetical protein